MAINVPIVSTFDAKGINKAIRDFNRLNGAANKSGFALQTMTSAANNGVKNLARFGAVAGGIGAVIGGTLVKAALESQKVMKQTDAIVKATGGAANLTTKQIGELANAMSLKTGVDDEAIQSSMNLLLTFKAVRNEVGAGNDIFTRASMAALDLGNVFGSTDAAAKQLGKALSDPVKGVSALKKAGVDFTDAQKKQIKTLVDSGNVLGAQKLILAEVESQVGGTAAATATDFDRMKVAVGNVAENLGTLLLPAFEATARFVTETLVPIFQTFSDIVGDKGVGAGFKYLGEQGLIALGKMNGWGTLIYGVVAAVVALNIATGIYTGLQTVATIAMTAFGTAATGAAVAVNAALFGIPALIGLIVVVLVALALRFKNFRELMITVGKTLFDVFKTVGNFFFDNVVNPLVRGINILIKAFNSLPLLADIPLLGELQIGTDKAAKGLKKVASAADFRKFEGFNAGKTTTKKTPTPVVIDTTATDKAKTALAKYTSALKLFGSETKAYKDAVKGVTTATMSLANATDDVRVAQEQFNKISKGYGAASKEAAVATREFSDAQRSAVRATLSLRDATRNVAEAQQELNNLKSGKGLADANSELAAATAEVADAEKNIIGLRGRARQTQQLKLEKALQRQADAQEAVTEESKKYTPEAIRLAEEALTTAILDEEDAKIALSDANQDVIDKQKELNEVVNGAATDSDKYKEAQKKLIDAQNAERDAVDALADAYDRQAESARKLKKAKDDLDVAAKGTTAKQERQAQIDAGINPDTGLPISAGGTGGGGSSADTGGYNLANGGLPSIDFSTIDFSGIDLSGFVLPPAPEPAPAPVEPPMFDFSTFDFSGIDFSGIDFSGFSVGGLATLAEGGIVNKPTLAMIGEGGEPEAVIPLSQLGNMGSGTNVTINVNGGDPNAVVDALRRYMRQNGSIPIRTSNIF